METVEPELQDLSGLDALRVMLTEIKASYEKSPRSLSTLYALIFEAVGPIPELRDRFVAFHRNQRTRVATYIRSGLGDGSIRTGIDPDEQAAMIVGQLRGVGYLWKLDPDGIDSGAVLAAFIDQVVRDLAAAPRQVENDLHVEHLRV